MKYELKKYTFHLLNYQLAKKDNLLIFATIRWWWNRLIWARLAFVSSWNIQSHPKAWATKNSRMILYRHTTSLQDYEPKLPPGDCTHARPWSLTVLQRNGLWANHPCQRKACYTTNHGRLFQEGFQNGAYGTIGKHPELLKLCVFLIVLRWMSYKFVIPPESSNIWSGSMWLLPKTLNFRGTRQTSVFIIVCLVLV